MVLPFILRPEHNEALFEATLVPASVVSLFVVLLQGLIIPVIPVGVIFGANMAALVFLLHVLNESLDVEEILLAKRAVWMENC